MLLYHLLFRSIPMAANHLLNQWCPRSPVPMCIAMLRWINQGLSAGYIFCATFCISALNLVWVMGNHLVANSQITVVIEMPHRPNTMAAHYVSKRAPISSMRIRYMVIIVSSDSNSLCCMQYSISQQLCTQFCCALLCCGYAIVHNEFTSTYPYSSGLLCWHWGNR